MPKACLENHGLITLEFSISREQLAHGKLFRDGCRIFVAPVTFQLLWGIYFKRIGQLANNYCTVLHIVSFVLFFSELAKCPQESLIFFKFIVYAVKIGIETLSKPILENHKIVWKVLCVILSTVVAEEQRCSETADVKLMDVIA